MHRAAGATEVMIALGGALCAPARAARRAGTGPAGPAGARCRRSIWCWSRATSATPIPKLEVHRAANGKPLLQPDDPRIVAIASDSAAAAGRAAGGRSQRHRGRSPTSCWLEACRADRRARLPRGARDGATHRRLLRIRRPAAAGRRHGAADRRARARRSTETETRAACGRARPRAGARRRRADRSAAVRQFRGRRLRRAPRRPRRHGRDAARGRRSRSPPAAPRPRRSAPARRSASSPARRCRPAPTPCSCRRTRASRAIPSIVPPGLKRGANRRLAGEDVRRARSCCRPAGGSPRRTSRSPPRSGSPRCRCAVACGSRCSRPATRSSSRARRAPRRGALRRQPLSARRHAASGSAPRSPISASCRTTRRRWRARIAAAAQATTWC